jgi:starch phosphorylase
VDNAKFVAGSEITVRCQVYLPNIDKNHIEVQVYFGQIQENGTVKNVFTQAMKNVGENNDTHIYNYEATINLSTGGNFGYSFRVVPKHEMLLDQENLNLVKWIEK